MSELTAQQELMEPFQALFMKLTAQIVTQVITALKVVLANQRVFVTLVIDAILSQLLLNQMVLIVLLESHVTMVVTALRDLTKDKTVYQEPTMEI